MADAVAAACASMPVRADGACAGDGGLARGVIGSSGGIACSGPSRGTSTVAAGRKTSVTADRCSGVSRHVSPPLVRRGSTHPISSGVSIARAYSSGRRRARTGTSPGVSTRKTRLLARRDERLSARRGERAESSSPTRRAGCMAYCALSVSPAAARSDRRSPMLPRSSAKRRRRKAEGACQYSSSSADSRRTSETRSSYAMDSNVCCVSPSAAESRERDSCWASSSVSQVGPSRERRGAT